MPRNKDFNKSGNWGGNKTKPKVGEQAQEALIGLNENNPVMKMFNSFKEELDDKHDRYEKIVKHSRDITIESKRIIFLLHNTNVDIEEKREGILNEAKTRLLNVVNKNFKEIAEILKEHDPYQYHKAYTSGMQEFIEALLFLQYLSNEYIESFNKINEIFIYKSDLTLMFSQYDYILGIADFTGELMRRCINSLGMGNINNCFSICNFVKCLNTGYLGLIHTGNKELSRKMWTLKNSLDKMELVCYNIQIRGSEVPKHMLASVIENAPQVDDDEGYF